MKKNVPHVELVELFAVHVKRIATIAILMPLDVAMKNIWLAVQNFHVV